MARPQSDDLIQSFRFQVQDTGSGDPFLDPAGGFASITIPGITFEEAMYREGNRKYTIKQPGVPTVESSTLQRGVAKKDTAFASWALTKVLGGAPYRTDLAINIFDQEEDGTNVDHTPKKVATFMESFPLNVKFFGDLDANTSDINLQELELSVEEIQFKSGKEVIGP